MVRFALLEPRLSWAVTMPLASDTPLALTLLMNALGSVPVENVTVWPLIACLVASSTIAVRVTGLTPELGICVSLARSSTEATVGPVGVGVVDSPGVPPAPPEPQPAKAATVAARKSHAENLEISRLNKLRVTKIIFCTQAPFYAIRIDILRLI